MLPHFSDGEDVEVIPCDNYYKGDFIVFDAGVYGRLIKMITGVPGDKIPQTCHLRNWSDVYGNLCENWYIVEGTTISSIDSRIFGPICKDYILGKAVKINA